MASFSTLGTAVSGLNAAQAGLYVLGHNVSNNDTTGYSRQRVLQNDFSSTNVGRNHMGSMQVGLGTNVAAIKQIRSKFRDMAYRESVTKSGYYTSRVSTGQRIEDIMGELDGDYSFRKVLDDLWFSMQELSVNPEGIDTRSMFMASAGVFVDKVNNVSSSFRSEQDDLNEEIKSMVSDVNKLLNTVSQMNVKIAMAEACGESANDYRDTRNNALDELSLLLPIDYRELNNGMINVTCEGTELVVAGSCTRIGLRYSSSKCDFVEPVITTEQKILPYDPTDSNAKPLFKMATESEYKKIVSSNYDTDKGMLKGMLLARGNGWANYTMTPGSLQEKIEYYDNIINTSTDPEEIRDAKWKKADAQKQYFNIINCDIPKAQMKFDKLVNAIVTMINDVVAPRDKDDPDAPHGIDINQSQFLPVFVRDNTKYEDRYDGDGNYIEEDPNNYYTLYSMGNLKINPELLGKDNYDKLAFSYSTDVGDQNALMDMLEKWKSGWDDEIAIDDQEAIGINDYYRRMLTDIASEVREYYTSLEEHNVKTTDLDNKRKQISGVSMDEEMKSMLVYQHAYNASSRMISIIDSMIDKVINGTGRVGM